MPNRLHLYVIPPASNSNTPRVAAEYEQPVDVLAEWRSLKGPRPTLPELDGEQLGAEWGDTGWCEFEQFRPSGITARTRGVTCCADTIEASEAVARAWGAELDALVDELRAKIAQRRADRRAEIARTISRPGTLTIPDGILDW
jgi:hypothetical protein